MRETKYIEISRYMYCPGGYMIFTRRAVVYRSHTCVAADLEAYNRPVLWAVGASNNTSMQLSIPTELSTNQKQFSVVTDGTMHEA